MTDWKVLECFFQVIGVERNAGLESLMRAFIFSLTDASLKRCLAYLWDWARNMCRKLMNESFLCRRFSIVSRKSTRTAQCAMRYIILCIGILNRKINTRVGLCRRAQRDVMTAATFTTIRKRSSRPNKKSSRKCKLFDYRWLLIDNKCNQNFARTLLVLFKLYFTFFIAYKTKK